MPVHHLAVVAAEQLGLVTVSQARRHLSASSIRQAVRSGRLRRVERAVFQLPGAPVTLESRVLAKVLSAGDGAVASHLTAAWLWALIDAPPERVDVSVPRGRRPRTPGVRVHTSSDLELVIPGTRRQIPVTDVGRTLLDCAAIHDLDVQLLIDSARRLHQISPSLLPWVVATHARSGRPGITALRDRIALDELPASDFERIVCRWLSRVRIAGWVLHPRIVVPGYGPCEPDVAWLPERVILELEGGDHRDRAAVHANDTARQNALALAGWSVLRVTYGRWVGDTERVREELTEALARARRTLR